MSFYIIKKNWVVISGVINSLQRLKGDCDIEYSEIEPENISDLLKIRPTIYNFDCSSFLYKDGKPCSVNHMIESEDRPYILNLEEKSLYQPFFVFTAINGKKYYVQDIYLADFEKYRLLNFTKEELSRIWGKVERYQFFNDFIEKALSENTYDVEEEIALKRITHEFPEDAIYIDDEFFELLEDGHYQEFLEELLEIDLIDLIEEIQKH